MFFDIGKRLRFGRVFSAYDILPSAFKDFVLRHSQGGHAKFPDVRQIFFGSLLRQQSDELSLRSNISRLIFRCWAKTSVSEAFSTNNICELLAPSFWLSVLRTFAERSRQIKEYTGLHRSYAWASSILISRFEITHEWVLDM